MLIVARTILIGFLFAMTPVLTHSLTASWHQDAPAFSGDMRDMALRSELFPAPSYEFLGPDEVITSLGEFRGRVVLLNFWATWCPPCVEEMPSLDRLQAKMGDERFDVIALSLDRGGHETIKAFYEEHGLSSLAAYADNQQKAMVAFAVGALPTTILIGPAGNIVATLAGPAEWDSPEALALISYLKSQAPIGTN